MSSSPRESRVSLLAVTVDGPPASVRLDTGCGGEPIVYLGTIALHCTADPATLKAVAAAFDQAARIAERRRWLHTLPEVV